MALASVYWARTCRLIFQTVKCNKINKTLHQTINTLMFHGFLYHVDREHYQFTSLETRLDHKLLVIKSALSCNLGRIQQIFNSIASCFSNASKAKLANLPAKNQESPNCLLLAMLSPKSLFSDP